MYLLTKIHTEDTRRYTQFLLTKKVGLGGGAVSPKWDLEALCEERGSDSLAEMATRPAMWNGRAVLVTLSEESETGFLNVLKQPGGRKKPFYVKFKPDGEKRQRMLPGSSSATAWEGKVQGRGGEDRPGTELRSQYFS